MSTSITAVPVSVTFFNDATAATKREQTLGLHDLAELIITTTAAGKKDLPWVKLARFGDTKTPLKQQPDGRWTGGSLRHNGNLRACSGVEGDYDSERVSFADAVSILTEAGVSAIVYTSPSHTEAKPRWRVLCQFSKECSPEQRDRYMNRLNGVFGGVFSNESWTLSQSYYYGSVNHNPDHRVEMVDGIPIDLMDELDATAIGKPKTGTGRAGDRPVNPATGSYEPASNVRLERYRQTVLDTLRREAVDGQKHTALRSAAIILGGIQVAAGFSDAEATAWLMDCLPSSVIDWPAAVETARWGLERGRERPIELENRQWSGNGSHAPPEPPQPNGEGDYGVGREAGHAPDDLEANVDPQTRSNGQDQADPPPKDKQKPRLIVDVLPHLGVSNIPPRPWAYGKYLLLGQASVLGGADGGGKGAMAVVVALSVITGRPLLGEKVWRTGPVVIVSYEDDADEWHRRIAAACMHYGIDYDLALNNIHFVRSASSKDRVSFGRSSTNGTVLSDGAEIIAILEKLGAVLLIIDPFNHAHGFDDGNNNATMAQVAAEMNRIARESKAAALVLHHLRKGASGQIDDLMGATSLRATFRSTRILTRMTREEAEALQVKEHWRYSRIAGSKENYAPPPDKMTWFKLESIELGNANEDYPDGDNIQVTVTWTPPSPFEGIDGIALTDIFKRIRRGTDAGEPDYSPHRQAKAAWVGNIIMERASKSDEQAAKIVKLWIKNEVLVIEKYNHPVQRGKADRVVLNEPKVAEILAPLRPAASDADL